MLCKSSGDSILPPLGLQFPAIVVNEIFYKYPKAPTLIVVPSNLVTHWYVQQAELDISLDLPKANCSGLNKFTSTATKGQNL